MKNDIFVNFDRQFAPESYKADMGEKLGNLGLGLLRTVYGKPVRVITKLNNPNDPVFREGISSTTTAKVFAMALFILALPLTAPLALIGYISTTCSGTYNKATTDYINYEKQKAAPKQIGFKSGRKERVFFMNDKPGTIRSKWAPTTWLCPSYWTKTTRHEARQRKADMYNSNMQAKISSA